jgi:hypothetical protein
MEESNENIFETKKEDVVELIKKHKGRKPGAKDKRPRKKGGYFARWSKEQAIENDIL